MGSNQSSSQSSSEDDLIQDTHHWYTKFMKECPSGQLSLHEFKALLGLHGMNPQANHYVEQVFNTFDLNKDGFIDFLEFIAAINLVIRGKIDQKLKWYFKLYDADGNGTIDKKELAVQAINGNSEMSPEDYTNMVFQKIDINNDGRNAIFCIVEVPDLGSQKIPEQLPLQLKLVLPAAQQAGELTLEEFINGVESDEALLEMISKSFDLSNVLKVIQSGRRHSI
ncbi:hypothetical protein lerEdw1_011328 [Lerista edwardsae]|nr:hypothetical protein lerEdw1_011328 [Lerista edwardsae]